MNAEWQFLTHLRDIGRRAAEAWAAENYAHIGHRSTVDLRQEFL
jgi:NTE family protein